MSPDSAPSQPPAEGQRPQKLPVLHCVIDAQGHMVFTNLGTTPEEAIEFFSGEEASLREMMGHPVPTWVEYQAQGYRTIEVEVLPASDVSALRLEVERLKADALILENNYSVAAQNEGALQAEVERLRKALETVIGDLEGYEDGAPDASSLSKTVNATLAQARSSLTPQSTEGKQP